jgi:hypothetical protein
MIWRSSVAVVACFYIGAVIGWLFFKPAGAPLIVGGILMSIAEWWFGRKATWGVRAAVLTVCAIEIGLVPLCIWVGIRYAPQDHPGAVYWALLLSLVVGTHLYLGMRPRRTAVRAAKR